MQVTEKNDTAASVALGACDADIYVENPHPATFSVGNGVCVAWHGSCSSSEGMKSFCLEMF